MRSAPFRGPGQLGRAVWCAVMGTIGLFLITAGLQQAAVAGSCNNMKSVEGGINYGSCSGAGTCLNVRYNDTCVNQTNWKCQQVSPSPTDKFRNQNCKQQSGGAWTCTGSLIDQAGARDDFVSSSCST